MITRCCSIKIDSILRHLLLSSIILLFSVGYSLAQNTIADGDWTNITVWDTGTLPGITDNVTVNNTIVIPFGTTVEIGSLTISPTGSLSVYGTLIVNGDMTMEFTGTQESEFIMGRNSAVVVNGNVTLSNKVTITLSSYFIVTGDFTKAGSSNQGSLTVDGAHIYLLGTVNIPTTGSGSWSSFTTCNGTYTGTTSDINQTCDYGTAQDFANNIDSIPSDILNLLNCTSSTSPYWNGTSGIPHSQGEVSVGSDIVLQADAVSDVSSVYTPVYYHWSGPNGFSQTTTSQAITIAGATAIMSGYYDCSAVNSIGCSITDSTYVLVSDCGLSGAGYYSRNDYTGNWGDPLSWGASDPSFVIPPANNPTGSQNITVNGYITLNDNLTVNGAQQYICDTLVVTGDFIAQNPSLTVGPNGLLIVMGNYNGSVTGGTIDNLGNIIFTGTFDNTGNKITNSGQIYVFDSNPTLGNLLPTGTTPYDLPTPLHDFYCSLSGSNCSIGSTSAVFSGDATITLGQSTNLFVAITGGTAPYTVVYSDGTTNYTVSNYVSGDAISVTPNTTTTYSLVSVVDATSNLGIGNSGTPTVTVQVNPPVFTNCPGDTTLSANATNASGQCGAYVYYNVPVVNDNSGAFTGDLSSYGLTYMGQYKGHSYYYTNSKLTPTDAQAKAFEVGGHLATISSWGEDQYLADNTPWTNVNTTDGSNYKYWIGLTDADNEGVWKWVTGEPLTYTNWSSSQPNNLVRNGVDQDWAELWNFVLWTITTYHDYYGEWNDGYNDDTRQAIIEFEGPRFTMDSGLPSGSFFTVGTHTISFSTIDVDGNTATCSFQITVTETEPPTIVTSGDIPASTDAGTCSASVSVTDPTYSDNCSVASLTWAMTGATTDTSPSTGINLVGTHTFNSGTTTITWTVTDNSGNTATATQKVTVTDDQAPSFGQSFANIQECAVDTSNQSFTINQLISAYSDPGYDRNVDPTLLIDNCTAYSSIQIEYMIQANNGTSDLGLISDWLTANNLDSYEFSYDNLKASFLTATMFHVYYRITDASNNSTITSFYITVDPVPKPGQIIPN